MNVETPTVKLVFYQMYIHVEPFEKFVLKRRVREKHPVCTVEHIGLIFWCRLEKNHTPLTTCGSVPCKHKALCSAAPASHSQCAQCSYGHDHQHIDVNNRNNITWKVSSWVLVVAIA